MSNFLTRWIAGVSKAAEGEYRPGPYNLRDGWLSSTAGRFWNWWQSGYSLQNGTINAPILEACISAYAQTVAMCPGTNYLRQKDNSRTPVENSACARILRRPNDYQSPSDFLMNLVRNLYSTGNAYGLAVRNDRGEISELHLMRNGKASIAENGEIFYKLSGNEVMERRFILDKGLVPARDVLHVKLSTPRNILNGETPVLAAMMDLATRDAMVAQQLAFYQNQAKPSIVLTTEEKLNPTEMDELRARWDEQTKGEKAGGTPILAWGLKAEPIASTSEDNQMVELFKLTDQSVAMAFRIPLQILGLGGTPFASTELLMQQWVASGLGFALNHIEQAFDRLFKLKGYPFEYTEFDTNILLRSSFKERMESLGKAVQNAIFSPDEARAFEGMPPAPDGHGKQPRVQQQLVPLSFGTELKPNTPAAAPNPSADKPDDSTDNQDDNTDNENDASSKGVEDAKAERQLYDLEEGRKRLRAKGRF